MRLYGIKAKNFLSLHDCEITDLNAHQNFIVGPNGSGKTTLFRLLRVIRDTFTAASIGERANLSDLCTQGMVPQEVDLSITVEFNTQWEQELILAFLWAALSQPNMLSTALTRLKNQSIQIPSDEHLAFTQWLMQNIQTETIPFFFRGDLRVTYRAGLYEYLRLSYTFMCKKEPVTVIMGANGTFCQGKPPQVVTSGFSGADRLLTFLWEPRTHKKPEQGGPLAEFFTQQSTPEPASLNAEEFFLFLANQKGTLHVESIAPDYTAFSFYSVLSQASGIDFSQGSGRILSFSALFSILLNRALVFTNNVRLPFSMPIALDIYDVLSKKMSFDDEQQIPKWLFRLKNGDDAEQARFQRIQESFSTIVGSNQSFDLFLRRLPQKAPGSIQEPLPELDIRVKNASGNISLAYQGAGIWEALVLSTLLDESEGHLVLLDEPAANLHPGMQHKLVEVLRATPGQVIVVTHSAHLLPVRAADFQYVYRTQKNHKGTQIRSLQNSTLVPSDKLEKKLHVSSDIPGLLFSNGVILVEGATELGALNEWFTQSTVGQGRTLADLNIALYAVGGKDEFPFYLRFLTVFGVPWAIICDGDALPPDTANNSHIWETLKELKRAANIPPTGSSFDSLKTLAEEAGMYTANTSPSGKFEVIPAVQHYLSQPGIRFPSGKSVLKGRAIAQQVPCPLEVDDVLQKMLKRLIKDLDE